MPVIDDYKIYFQLVHQFNTAPHWQKELLVKGSLLTACKEIEPANARLKLRLFWLKNAAALNVKIEELKTWA